MKLIAIIAAVVVAQYQTTIPDLLLPFAQNRIVTTNLRLSLLKNNTKDISDICKDTFKHISHHRKIKYNDMVSFINDTVQEMHKNVANTTEGQTANLPGNDVITEAATLAMTNIGGQPNATIHAKQFEQYLRGIIEKNFTYAPEICYAVQKEQLQCRLLSSDNSTLQSVYKDIGPRMDAVAGMCRNGLTSFGGYRLEACQLDISGKLGVTTSLSDLRTSCMQQFQCYFMPNERRQNPWNVTVSALASYPLNPQPATAQLLAVQPILMVFFNEAYKEVIHSHKIKKIFTWAGIFTALLIPAVFIAASTLLLSVVVGPMIIVTDVFITDFITNMLLPGQVAGTASTFEDVTQHLNVVSN